MRLEQQLGEHRRRLHVVGELDEHAEGQRVVDHRLADVENARAGVREDARQRMRDAGLVVTRDVDVEDAGFNEGWQDRLRDERRLRSR